MLIWKKGREKQLNNQELIVIKQLPIIEQQLKMLAGDIKTKVDAAMSLPCTADTVKDVKKARAELNKQYTELEERRKVVKTAIMQPYNEFEQAYKEYVGTHFTIADKALKGKIDNVEDGLRLEKENNVKAYFAELAEVNHIEWLDWERAKPNITLSASEKALKEAVKTTCERLAEEVSFIEQQENFAELLAEYQQCLNLAQAGQTVKARHDAITKAQEQATEAKAAKEREEEAAAKVIAFAPPVAAAPVAPPAPPKPLKPAEQIFTLSFKVRATKDKLTKLKQFLNDGGYQYE